MNSVPDDLRERVEVKIRECQAMGSDAQDMAAAIFREIDAWQADVRAAHEAATKEPEASQAPASDVSG